MVKLLTGVVSSQAVLQDNLVISDNGVTRLMEITGEKGWLRVAVEGGGCSLSIAQALGIILSWRRMVVNLKRRTSWVKRMGVEWWWTRYPWSTYRAPRWTNTRS